MNTNQLRMAVSILVILALAACSAPPADGTLAPAPQPVSVPSPHITATPTSNSFVVSEEASLPTLPAGQEYAVLPWTEGRMPNVGETLQGMSIVAVIGFGDDITGVGIADDPAVITIEILMAVYVVVAWCSSDGPQIAATALVNTWESLTAWVAAVATHLAASEMIITGTSVTYELVRDPGCRMRGKNAFQFTGGSGQKIRVCAGKSMSEIERIVSKFFNDPRIGWP
ncbi:hypothetical protein AUK40_03645 [Candidatus Wirthbacteria bacterium CG2_30_54_11]|uniref:Uncharacterized protein n=1 Tax=Candidatus Wirthbacteria bacterium CG2_30_54_11 TaxID=1817892 RepID=A0A1J5IS36_9BACT|nr:MAG: hypothetical protein AUK40_03645 [Candidatus Wirthbacteria bacterium CG2_30_54_11]